MNKEHECLNELKKCVNKNNKEGIIIKIIAICGIDKSGKATQSKLLTDELRELGYKVVHSEFPRYDTVSGGLIRDWLTKKWYASKHTFELLQTINKQEQQEWFEMLEAQGIEFLILDRYTLSQTVYGLASGVDGRWIIELQKYMRKPDLDIVIDIPANVSLQRKGKHNNGINDRYEEDLQLLERVRDLYLNVSTSYSAPKKIIIDGQQSIEKIHKDIMENVKAVIKF